MPIRSAVIAAGLSLAFAALLFTGSGWSGAPATERASVSSAGAEANGPSFGPALSDDGRYVVFTSDASNLSPSDTNGRDVFVHDRQTGSTELVTIASDGTQANRAALFPAISGNGRYIAFQSDADNLVPGDTNGVGDIFLHDRQTGVTERVSLTNSGAQANGESFTPSVSADGRYVTFTSRADNLVAGDTNSTRDVFLRDRQTGVTELLSVSTAGEIGNDPSGGLGAGAARISSDGRYVVFGSFAGNLAPGDSNLRDDVFLRDRQTGVTELLSVSTSGELGNGHSMYPDVSDDGRYVIYHSLADNLVAGDSNGQSDVFLRDRDTGVTTLLSAGIGGTPADGLSHFAVISADGRFAAYPSDATNLVAGDTNGQRDIFLQEIASGDVERVNLSSSGGKSGGPSSSAAIDGSGNTVAYQSFAGNLVASDSNDAPDVFVWGTPLSPAATPTQAAPAGDADCSSAVNAIDAALILQLIAGLVGTLPCPVAADANASGNVDAIDAALVLQFVAGLVGTLPP
ncbi:MAG: PD40 domain-containing protein [Chloroflexi bacterium]|nr:PD40 domain-containing protein [Chloroflexota bacterium]